MDQVLTALIIAILLALALGFLLGWVLRSRSQPAGSGEEALVLRTQLEMLQKQNDALKGGQETENKILLALNPVAERLNDMQRVVAELEKQRSDQHGQITEQLRAAMQSDELLRSTTEGLASALRSNSMRGKWGEVQLRRVVEAAGLIERVDFDLQSSISSDAGLGKPDMVVHLPGGKNIAVDAKVPFTAYMEASTIPMTATGEEGARREKLLKDHVAAVRAHIDALGKKSYWDGLDASPELVICFIPSEALVSSALEADPGLMDHAFSKKVALASPVTLWSVLKTVAFSWQQDVLTEDAAKIFDVGRELLQRLGAMAGHVETLGRSLTSSVKNYNSFVGSLESRVFPSARKLTELGSASDLPETLESIESLPRGLSAAEMTHDERSKD
ncbi:MAG: DNA recombination protein RmuC [Pontimonas sp.]|jgi:DNA recombination protein RmuC